MPAQAKMQACTEIGCVDGLTLTVAPDYHWAVGHYVFALKLDGRAVTCTGNLPLQSCGSIQCDGAGVMIMESGCALPPAAQGFGDITMAAAPKQVVVKITRDDVVLVDKAITPQYHDSRPNGADCAPQCHQATAPLFGAVE